MLRFLWSLSWACFAGRRMGRCAKSRAGLLASHVTAPQGQVASEWAMNSAWKPAPSQAFCLQDQLPGTCQGGKGGSVPFLTTSVSSHRPGKGTGSLTEPRRGGGVVWWLECCWGAGMPGPPEGRRSQMGPPYLSPFLLLCSWKQQQARAQVRGTLPPTRGTCRASLLLC